MSHVKPQLDELDVELKGLAWSEVKQLAVQLKVEYPTLRKIEEKYNSDAEPCLLTAMQCWLDEDTTASWGKIVDALRAIDKRVLADDIEKKYSSLATPPEPQINHPQDSSAPPVASTNDGERSLTSVQQEVQSLPSGNVKSTTDISSSAAQKRITPPTVSASVSMATKGSSMGSTHEGQITVQCYPMSEAPCKMMRGSTTTDQQFAYFASLVSYLVYCYEWSTEQWKELPPCPYRDSALVIIDGALTTVGGWSGSEYTNKLFTLRQGQWVEEYPPMKTARSDHAAVSTPDGDYIIVIGGSSGFVTAKIELFQVKTRQWYELTNLPQPLSYASATICGNQIHVIGGDGNGYSCSLQALPSSDEPITPQSLPDLISWTPLPRLPVTHSTAATLSGQLVIIGGWQGGPPVNSIHQLVEGQWVEIGSTTSGRRWCLSVSPSPDRVMIVGGIGVADSVEECVVVQ